MAKNGDLDEDLSHIVVMQGEIRHLEPEREHVDDDCNEERFLACVVDAAPPIGSDLLQRRIDQRFHAGVIAQYWRWPVASSHTGETTDNALKRSLLKDNERNAASPDRVASTCCSPVSSKFQPMLRGCAAGNDHFAFTGLPPYMRRRWLISARVAATCSRIEHFGESAIARSV